MDELLVEFITETNEFLETVDQQLVIFEADPTDIATLNRIFRLVHTIKGTCGFLGLPRLQRVAHVGETLLGKFRDGGLVATPDRVQLVLESIDRIKEILTAIEATGREPDGDDHELIVALEHASDAQSDVDLILPVSASAHAAPTPWVAIGERRTNPKARAIGDDDDEAISKAGAISPGQSIRVNVDVLESLMAMVGELKVTRDQLVQRLPKDTDNALGASLHRLAAITEDLQDCLLKTRLQPIGSVWKKLPRIVRDAGRDLGKKIELVMVGDAIELDRHVLELIKDPLTHMIRNACDHGLEGPADRLRAGKPEVGTIKLGASRQGNQIIIELSDDGVGLSTSRIRDNAIKRGLITPEQASALSDNDMHRFVFTPGFSTAEAITSLSGRGVGLDVVCTNVEMIGGTVDLRSIQGKGTTFIITLPISASIGVTAQAGTDAFTDTKSHKNPLLGIDPLPRQKPSQHIVLIERNPNFRNLLSPMLKAAGYDVEAVDTTSAALLCAQYRRPDVLLTDIDADVSAARRLLNDERLAGTKIVALSSEDDTDAVGFAAVVRKSDRLGLLAAIDPVPTIGVAA